MGTSSLWAHQQTELDASWELPTRARLWEPRTGKTRVCIEEIVQLSHGAAFRFLVVCPKTVAPVWVQEAQRRGIVERLLYDLSDGSMSMRRRYAVQARAGLMIVNYDALSSLLPQ